MRVPFVRFVSFVPFVSLLLICDLNLHGETSERRRALRK